MGRPSAPAREELARLLGDEEASVRVAGLMSFWPDDGEGEWLAEALEPTLLDPVRFLCGDHYDPFGAIAGEDFREAFTRVLVRVLDAGGSPPNFMTWVDEWLGSIMRS